MRQTLIIVGAGFSGTVLAVNLLRRPPAKATDIVLVERGGAVGRGAAYASHEFPYLLNVPASRLSADSHDPSQFLQYARSRLEHVDCEDFLPRALYGDYLQDLLLQAERAAPAHIKLVRVFGEVTSIGQGGAKPLAVQFAQREPIFADFAVLAIGTPTPTPPAWAAGVWHHSAFRQDPRDLPDSLSSEHSVLIAGNGLTMVDAVSILSRDARRIPMLYTISRRGLLPLPQTAFRAGAMQGAGESLLASAHSLRQLLKAGRALAREVEACGGDWREAVTLIRNLAPRLWRQLPAVERRRFVRHLQTHWDVHRHRLPPQLAERLDALRRSGRLQVNAGRIQSVIAVDRRLRVSWRARGNGKITELTADMVVNATGPSFGIEDSADALLSSLRTSGLVSGDPLHLGIRSARYGACRNAQGIASRHLYYLGPMLRADHWEATAALELRDHAEQLASHLAGLLSS